MHNPTVSSLSVPLPADGAAPARLCRLLGEPEPRGPAGPAQLARRLPRRARLKVDPQQVDLLLRPVAPLEVRPAEVPEVHGLQRVLLSWARGGGHIKINSDFT